LNLCPTTKMFGCYILPYAFMYRIPLVLWTQYTTLLHIVCCVLNCMCTTSMSRHLFPMGVFTFLTHHHLPISVAAEAGRQFLSSNSNSRLHSVQLLMIHFHFPNLWHHCLSVRCHHSCDMFLISNPLWS